jgi:hypothetical protein
MSIPEEYKGKYFYHFTHIENLESICKNGLLSTNKKKELGIDHVNVANMTIQERRSNMDVTCTPFGKVHDYVPFYWCTVNPMMIALLNAKNIDQQHLVFLAVSIEKLLDENSVFTSYSANTADPPDFYNHVTNLGNLDWEAINLRRWSSEDDDERHRRMAEVLIYEQVPFSMIDSVITWNPSYRKIVEEGLEKLVENPPKVVDTKFNSRYFYFTQYPHAPTKSLVTGPYWLKRHFEETVENIKKKRSELPPNHIFAHNNISNLIDAITDDFCVLPELKGIHQLETVNDVHSENVSDHTLNVVNNLTESDCYSEFIESEQNILKLSAFLHDIGKGPKSKWKNSNPPGKQPAFPDHPVDALPMLERILSEEIEEIANNEVRLTCLLVAYHDLIGEIIGKGRDIEQLVNIIESEKEFDMLNCLNRADVASFRNGWIISYRLKVGEIKKHIIEKLNEK